MQASSGPISARTRLPSLTARASPVAAGARPPWLPGPTDSAGRAGVLSRVLGGREVPRDHCFSARDEDPAALRAPLREQSFPAAHRNFQSESHLLRVRRVALEKFLVPGDDLHNMERVCSLVAEPFKDKELEDHPSEV